MKRQDITFRIIKIGKTAVSVAVYGLMGVLPQVVMGGQNNLNDSASITKASNTDSVGVYYNNGGSGTYSGNISITLNSGISLSGDTGVGSVPFAIYTLASGGNNYYFVNSPYTSTLNLQGNNQITGLVGVHSTGGSNYTIDPLSQINLNGTNITFNNEVYSNKISFSQGGLAQFYGNISNNSTGTLLEYLGNDATATLHNNVTLTGSITNTAKNGMLIFTGSGAITGSVATGNVTAGSGTAVGIVEVRGNGAVVSIGNDLSTDKLDFKAASTVAVGRDLYLNADTSIGASNAVKFNNSDGVLQVGGNITGVLGKIAVSTGVNNTGTLTMVSGNQSILGNLGADGLSLKTLNIGGVNSGVGLDTSSNVSSTTTISGNVFAQTISLNNNIAGPTSSTLNMASGYNINGSVVTENNGLGNLTLQGGTQTVTGNVGASGLSLNTVSSGANGAVSTFTGNVTALTVSNTGTGTSNYQGNVSATTVNVANGVSNFSQALTATTTNIGSGTGNFSSSANTSTALVFNGQGVANLNNGLTGTVAFGANANATVNLADGKTISGTITATPSNGTLNTLGSATLNGDVTGLKTLNVSTSLSSKVVSANGNVTAQTVSLQNDGVLRMADARNLTGTVTTTSAGTGSLDFLGTSTVTGNVGAAGLSLKTVSGGVDSSTVTFNSGLIFANTLAYTGNGTVVLNGLSPSSPTLGLVGAVDFGTNNSSTGTLSLGNNVSLVTQNAINPTANTQTTFVDANAATLRFLGNSTVTGNLGAADNAGNQNFKSVYGGADGSTVNFLGKVYVSGSTFHVSGTGTVNFADNLYGPLIYDANGTVNVADGKGIYPSVDVTANGNVQTATANTGTLNYLGSTTTQVPIGTDGTNMRSLRAVNFHSDGNVSSATVNIGHDVYATNTNIGNSNANGTTIANVTATGKYLGDNLTLSNTTTLNTAGDPSTYSRVTDGTLLPSGTVTQSSIGAGALTTNNATLNFAVGSQAWAAGGNGSGGLVNANGSSKISGASTLAMGVDSKVNVSLLGSLRNGQSVTLIDVAGSGAPGNSNLPTLANYSDNSFVIDTALSRDNGDLVMTATRDANTYVNKSATSGHFSNNAAIRLGTLATAGTGYGQDMQTVLNKLDIDQWGYGNNQANLATQVKRLAPIVNNSNGLSVMALGSMVTNNIGLRMHELRNVPQSKAFETSDFWVKSNSLNGKQEAVGDYDGYTVNLTGISMGLDSRPDNSSIVGVALSYGTGAVRQTQFRDGDQANLKSWQVSLYGAYDFTPEFFVAGVLSMANQNTNGSRTTAVGRAASYDVAGNEVGLKLDVGYRIKFNDSTTVLTPMISLEDRTFNQNAYTETNAGDVGLNVAAQRLTSKQIGAGLRLSSTEYIGGMVVKPEVAVFSMRDSGQQTDPVSASFIGDASGSATFTTNVASYATNSTKLSLGAGLLMSKNASLVARYQYVKRDTFSSNMAELIARWNF